MPHNGLDVFAVEVEDGAAAEAGLGAEAGGLGAEAGLGALAPNSMAVGRPAFLISSIKEMWYLMSCTEKMACLRPFTPVR